MKGKIETQNRANPPTYIFFVVTLGIKKIDYALHRHKESIT